MCQFQTYTVKFVQHINLLETPNGKLRGIEHSIPAHFSFVHHNSRVIIGHVTVVNFVV